MLASLGAVLLTAGGAFLRTAFANGWKPRGAAANGDAGNPADRLARSESELSAMREELSQSNSVKEAQRIEMVEQRQRSERQVQGAQAEIQRLAGELDAEKARSKAADDELKELKTKVGALEEELKKPRATGPGPLAPAPDAKAAAALEGQVADLQKKLKAASDELKAKIMGAMSQRAVAALKEEMEFMGPVKMRDVEAAQATIVSQVRKLEETGEIVLSAGGDDVLI